MGNAPKDPVAVTSGRLGAYISHSRHDGRAITAAARAKAAARFVDQARAEAVERGEKLTEEELERRARMLRKAFAVRMALKSVMARQGKRNRSGDRGTVRAQKENADLRSKQVREEVRAVAAAGT